MWLWWLLLAFVVLLAPLGFPTSKNVLIRKWHGVLIRFIVVCAISSRKQLSHYFGGGKAASVSLSVASGLEWEYPLQFRFKCYFHSLNASQEHLSAQFALGRSTPLFRSGTIPMRSTFDFLLFYSVFSWTYWPLSRLKRSKRAVNYVNLSQKSSAIVSFSDLPPRKSPATVRFCAVSDTHEVENLLNIPDCDVLLHCGDVSFQDGNGSATFYARKANEWFGSLRSIKHKIIIGGNHDRFLERLTMEEKRELFSNAVYLENSGVDIPTPTGNIRIHGSPLSILGKSQNTAFQYARDSADGRQFINRAIPASRGSVDILLTHGMPFGKGDGKRVSHGCKMLSERVAELNPIVHVFGHRHQSYSVDFPTDGERTVYINAASLSPMRLPEHAPVVFDVEPEPKPRS